MLNNNTYYLGVDIGGTEVKIGVVKQTGEILHTRNYSVNYDGYNTPIIKTVRKGIQTFFEETGLKKENIKAIGVSATGAINTKEGIVAGSAGHIKGSMSALVRMVSEKLRKECILGSAEEQINGRWIFSEIAAGNKLVDEIATRWMDYIAAGIVGMVHIFNPEMVLIGGGVSAQQELFIDKVKEKVMSRAMPNFTQELEVKAAQLNNESGLAGAVYYCMQQEKEGI